MLTYTTSTGVRVCLYGGPHRWETIDGLVDLATAPVIAETAASVPAGVYRTTNGVIRYIDVVLHTSGGNLRWAWRHHRQLMALFHIDHRAHRLGTLRYTNDDYVTRCADVTATIQEPARVHRGSPAVIQSTLRFIAPDPTFYDPVATAPGPLEPDVFNGVAAVNVSCVNAGDEDAYPTMTWTGVVTEGTVTDAYGHWFQMLETLAAGDILAFDFDPQAPLFTLEDPPAAAVDVYDSQNSASRLVVVAPGTNNLVFAGDDAGDAAVIAINWHDRYSSHG